MILQRSDIAAFIANWDDKAANLRRIAAELNIGTDSLVFVDDNPFERNIVRREMPEICVPELPDDPALFSSTLADAGYFEAVEITKEDLARGASYQVSRTLRKGLVSTTDIAGYLESLDMELLWGRFDSVSLKRVTQLVNKTNQFNLTTRRYTEAEITAVIHDPSDNWPALSPGRPLRRPWNHCRFDRSPQCRRRAGTGQLAHELQGAGSRRRESNLIRRPQ